jgi:putative transposon-encoded protein
METALNGWGIQEDVIAQFQTKRVLPFGESA